MSGLPWYVDWRKPVQMLLANAIRSQDIAFQEICRQEFKEPVDEKKKAGDVDAPDSDPVADDPNDGKCDCGESGCTPDSRPCCANNSCKPFEDNRGF
jgi:hypothetical protein